MNEGAYALVEARLEAPVHFSDRDALADVTLSVHQDDPFATRMLITLDGAEVPWLFSRELLATGLLRPCGEGNVVVVPCRNDDGRRLLAVYLRGPEGSARIDLDAEVVTMMLSLSERFIAAGSCADVLAGEVEGFLRNR